MEQSFIAFLEDSIKKNWDLDALTDYKGATLQYKDVARKIEKLHIIFELSGIKQGDKIAVCGRNSSHWGVTFLAAVTYGAVIVPILHEFKSDNIHNIVNHSEARLLMVGDMVWENLKKAAAQNARQKGALHDLWHRLRRLRPRSSGKKPLRPPCRRLCAAGVRPGGMHSAGAGHTPARRAQRCPPAGQRGSGFCRQGGVPESGRHRSAGALCPAGDRGRAAGKRCPGLPVLRSHGPLGGRPRPDRPPLAEPRRRHGAGFLHSGDGSGNLTALCAYNGIRPAA